MLEAIGWLATLSSFRGVPTDTMIRRGAERAVIRAEGAREGRSILLEAELVAAGRNRVLVNRQPLKRARDLLGVLRVTVFAPDDLELVKGGPAARRQYLDDALVATHPRHDALRGEVDKVLKQRNALLKSAGGRLDADAAFTLDVWDAKLVEAGGRLAEARQTLLERLAPVLAETYDAVANRPAEVTASYQADWSGVGLEAALAASRADDLRRGVSTVGPHRDDVDLRIGGLPARTHASQGEQRSLALSLRLAITPGDHRDHRQPAGAAARRRVLRARPRPQRRAPRQPPRGPDPPHERQRPAAEGPARSRARGARRSHRSRAVSVASRGLSASPTAATMT